TKLENFRIHCRSVEKEKFGKSFNEVNHEEVIEIVEEVAWPGKSKPEYEGAVSWFNMLRDMTCSGYFSIEAGWKYIGYVGKPTQCLGWSTGKSYESIWVQIARKVPSHLSQA